MGVSALLIIWGTNRSEKPDTKHQNINFAKSTPVEGYVLANRFLISFVDGGREKVGIEK